MPDRRLNRILGELQQTGTDNPPRPAHRDELESRLLTGFRTQHPRNRRWLMLLNPWNRTARFAVVGLALLMLGLGACTTSTTTEMEMGQKVTIGIADKGAVDVATIDTQVTAFFDTHPNVETANIMINETVDGPVVFEIVAWGESLDGDQLLADLRRAVPAAPGLDLQIEALTGTVTESYAARLKRDIFNIEIDGNTEEEIRAQIMAQLAEQGVAEGAVIDVLMDDGETEITITVEEDVEE